MMEIYNSYISFTDAIFDKNTGWDNLVNCIESAVMVLNCSWFNTFTYSSNIIYIIYSYFLMSNSIISYFYPNFIFGLFSQIYIQNNIFNNSIEKEGIFKVGAIYFQYNVSFSIISNYFSNIKNSSFGSVNLKDKFKSIFTIIY